MHAGTYSHIHSHTVHTHTHTLTPRGFSRQAYFCQLTLNICFWLPLHKSVHRNHGPLETKAIFHTDFLVKVPFLKTSYGKGFLEWNMTGLVNSQSLLPGSEWWDSAMRPAVSEGMKTFVIAVPK